MAVTQHPCVSHMMTECLLQGEVISSDFPFTLFSICFSSEISTTEVNHQLIKGTFSVLHLVKIKELKWK